MTILMRLFYEHNRSESKPLRLIRLLRQKRFLRAEPTREFNTQEDTLLISWPLTPRRERAPTGMLVRRNSLKVPPLPSENTSKSTNISIQICSNMCRFFVQYKLTQFYLIHTLLCLLFIYGRYQIWYSLHPIIFLLAFLLGTN